MNSGRLPKGNLQEQASAKNEKQSQPEFISNEIDNFMEG
jgi:hypothetical protein